MKNKKSNTFSIISQPQVISLYRKYKKGEITKEEYQKKIKQIVEAQNK
jgi:uncharacterized membrane protein